MPSFTLADEYDSYELQEPLPPIDVVLLIDVSGSMRFTDPYRAALTAAADFIDMLTLGQSRVGVVGFSGIMQYYLPFRLIEDENIRAEFRDEILNFQYVGFTDIGGALLIAAEVLYAAENLQNPMVLLMSDGWIQISPQLARTEADSFNDVEIALDILERTVPVYTIGIHNPFGVDVDLLEMIAQRSDAFAQFTEDANELPEMFISILETHVASIPVPDEVEEEEEIYEPEEDYEAEEIESAEELNEIEEDTEETYEPEEYLEYEETEAENGGGNGLLYTLAVFLSITAAWGVTRLIRMVRA